MNEKARRCVNALRTSCEENGSCPECPIYYWCHAKNFVRLEDTAADLIESLSEQLEQVTRERDAAVKELEKFSCASCINEELRANEEPCAHCIYCWGSEIPKALRKKHWQWRGVEVEG